MPVEYVEPDHTVEQEHLQDIGNGEQRRLQLRAKILDPVWEKEMAEWLRDMPEHMKAMTVQRDLPRYIGIEIVGPNGKLTDSLELLYHDGDDDKLAADWDMLVADPQTKSGDLAGWYIKMHRGMGYLRGGGVRMF